MKKTTGFSRSHIQMILNKIPFFRHFTQDEKEKLADEHSCFLVARPAEKIVNKDSGERAFYIILSGNACVKDGDSVKTLVTLQPGEFFGEIGFLTETPRTSDVVADDVCILLRIDQQLMSRLRAEIREKIKDQLIEKLVGRLIDS